MSTHRSPTIGYTSAMLDPFFGLVALCHSESALQGGLLLGLLAAGAAGSVVHCGPMCGVFVLGQVSERMARLPVERLCEWQRLRSGLLLPYHLGRLTTYGGLGALAAGSANLLGHATWFHGLSEVLLVAAALLFLAHALGPLLPSAGTVEQVPKFWRQLIGVVTRKIARGSASGEYLFGVVLGFLPCGLLYAAITAAAASADPVLGAAGMMAFGLGTTPVLVGIGVVGQAAGRRWSRLITGAAPALMGANAALLLALAWQRLG